VYQTSPAYSTVSNGSHTVIVAVVDEFSANRLT